MSRPRLLLVEDHALVGEALRAMLSREFTVSGPVTDGTEVLAAVAEHRPDVVLLDLTLPGRNGLDLIAEIQRVHPPARVLVVTMHAEWVMARAALGSGAAGFVPKDSSREELEHAIGEVLAGRTYLSSRLQPGETVSLPPSIRQAWMQLTPRHQQIVLGIAAGRSTEQIADEHGLSPHTIHFHRRSIRRIMGIESDDGLARTALLIQLALAEEAPRPGAGEPSAAGD